MIVSEVTFYKNSIKFVLYGILMAWEQDVLKGRFRREDVLAATNLVESHTEGN